MTANGVTRAEVEAGRRISLVFDDPEGAGAETLHAHEADGIAVNSRAFVDGLDWAKRTIFSFKDSVTDR